MQVKFLTPSYELEKEIQEEFKHLKINGEWFKLTKELDDFIKYLRIPECLLKSFKEDL